MLLLDTCILIYSIEGDPATQALVKARVAQLQRRHGAQLAISRVTLAECLVGAFKSPDTLLEAMYRECGKAMQVVEMSESVMERAARMRANAIRQLKMPDAIIAASCFEFEPKGVLVTRNVRDFDHIAGLVVEAI